MQTVTVNFKNSRNQDQTETFDVYARKELDLKARMTLIGESKNLVVSLGGEEWSSDDFTVEKQAAKLAGLDQKPVLVVRK